MTSTKFELFLQRLARSRLLDDEQLKQATAAALRESDPERAAVQLVAANFLTRWQARQLLSDKSVRFFLGHYKLLKELGRGSMGTVYRAVHPTMSRTVALKVMSRDILKDKRAVARFQREIRTAAALDHANIARALDAGCEKGIYYLVMEHVDGKDLRHWLKAVGPLPVAWSCECIRQAAIGLQHAYDRGIAHRDIKPSNLILVGKSLDEIPLIKIVDFGLARVGEDLAGDVKLTRVGKTVGTWAYMAPEQTLDSARADSRSDIFSLGCTFFQMITGELPFQGKSDVETLMLRLKVDAPNLSSLREGIDPHLDDIAARMMARDPADRFQTPADVAEALAGLTALDKKIAPSPKPAPTSVRVPGDDSSMSAFGNTEPEFDQFLQTIPDVSVRDSVIKQSGSAERKTPLQWLRYAIPALALFGLLLLIVWGISAWLG
jgi:serine/threonine protein kinase